MVTKDVILEESGMKIAGRLYLPDEINLGPRPTVCICHGIPSGRPPDPGDGGYPILAETICHEGFVVFIFNFRGTGTSEGNLDILSWTRDLSAAINYLCSLPEVDRSRMSLLGFSAGAAVSVFVAAHDARVSSVIGCACPAEFTFLNMAGESRSILERFRSIGVIRDKDFPPSIDDWISGFKAVSPIEFVAEIAPRPLLLVHGSRDETVTVSDARKLYAMAQEPKQLVIIEGAGHRLRQDDRAMAIVIDWLKSHSN